MILDEPTSMMDHISEQALIQRLRHDIGDKTLILITHRTSLLELVDRVIVFDKGQVVADGPKSILNQSGVKMADQTEPTREKELTT
jgi:ATP-binding cassette subfamily C protein LapB